MFGLVVVGIGIGFWFGGDSLRCNPDVHAGNDYLSVFVAGRGRGAVCNGGGVAQSAQCWDGEKIALQDDQLAVLVVRVQNCWAGVEGAGGAGLVFGEGDEGCCVGRCG